MIQKENFLKFCKSLKSSMKREYKKSRDVCLFPKITTIISSFKLEENYSVLSNFKTENYSIINKDFEISTFIKKEEIKDKKDYKKLRFTAKMIAQETANFQDELVFSLLDQSYSPIGTYGFWKYKEVWDKNSLQFEPEIKINKTGRLIGLDKKPLFGIHINFLKKKFYKNILFENLNLQNYRKVRKILLKWNKNIKLSNPQFLLIVKPELELTAREIEKKLKKDEKSNLLISPYLKNLNWALMLDSLSKPLIFQLRKNPEFELLKDKGTSLQETSFQKITKIILASNMRCNVGINDWKKIIGAFKNDIQEIGYYEKKDVLDDKNFSTYVREWKNERIPRKIKKKDIKSIKELTYQNKV